MKSRVFKKILIATDGSEGSKKAADTGIEVARISEAKVHAVYVIDSSSYSSLPKDPKWEEAMYNQFRDLGKEATLSVEEEAKKEGVEVEALLLEGNPAEEIINFAEKIDVDLIVLGSLGKGGIERFLIGSVSEKVVRNSKIPVLVVSGKE